MSSEALLSSSALRVSIEGEKVEEVYEIKELWK